MSNKSRNEKYTHKTYACTHKTQTHVLAKYALMHSQKSYVSTVKSLVYRLLVNTRKTHAYARRRHQKLEYYIDKIFAKWKNTLPKHTHALAKYARKYARNC